jgi:hypothetical protein
VYRRVVELRCSPDSLTISSKDLPGRHARVVLTAQVHSVKTLARALRSSISMESLSTKILCDLLSRERVWGQAQWPTIWLRAISPLSDYQAARLAETSQRPQITDVLSKHKHLRNVATRCTARADLPLCVQSSSCSKTWRAKVLHLIGDVLFRSGLVRRGTYQCIARARIPVISFEHLQTGTSLCVLYQMTTLSHLAGKHAVHSTMRIDQSTDAIGQSCSNQGSESGIQACSALAEQTGQYS